ncbi:MAG: hypothetical protein Kow0013_15530 [Pararhodobacter sp.]
MIRPHLTARVGQEARMPLAAGGAPPAVHEAAGDMIPGALRDAVTDRRQDDVAPAFAGRVAARWKPARKAADPLNASPRCRNPIARSAPPEALDACTQARRLDPAQAETVPLHLSRNIPGVRGQRPRPRLDAGENPCSTRS